MLDIATGVAILTYMNNTTATATRNGSKIVVTLPDGTLKILGGARAARAEVVIVTQFTGNGTFGTLGRIWREFECRADAAAGHNVAAVHMADTFRHRGAALPKLGADWSEVITVTDAA